MIEILFFLLAGVGLGLLFGPLITRMARRWWMPYRHHVRQEADQVLESARTLHQQVELRERERARERDKTRREILDSEGRVKRGRP